MMALTKITRSSALLRAAARYNCPRTILRVQQNQPTSIIIEKRCFRSFPKNHRRNSDFYSILKSGRIAPSLLFLTENKRSLSTTLTHDIGGDVSLLGQPIPPLQNLLAWEQQCHSLFAILASKGYFKTDELRRCIEALTPQQYESWSYYEKWTASMTTLLLEHGVITHEELQHALFGESTNTTWSSPNKEPLFQMGDYVKVRPYASSNSSVEWKRPHIRTPGYVYGVCGQIERVCDRHDDPSFLAFGLQPPHPVQLYRVRFRNKDIWPEQYSSKDDEEENFNGSRNDDGDNDVVEVEVYEHWLEPATSFGGHDFEDIKLFHHETGDDCIGHHHHHHHHHHDHDHDDVENHDHVHEARVHVEERAVRLEGPPRPGKELYQALVRLIKEKGIVTSDEIRIMSERMDTAGKQLDGATLVVEAWVNPAFEERLLVDAVSAAMEVGINAANPNAPTVLTVVKNTPKVHNLVVCTLCSCYPSALLGIAPSWYKSREYRARAVREPRIVLENDFGFNFEENDFANNNKQIRVHDSTADHRYLVLPERPPETEGWSKEQLRSLVTRDTMIGVSVPSPKV